MIGLRPAVLFAAVLLAQVAVAGTAAAPKTAQSAKPGTRVAAKKPAKSKLRIGVISDLNSAYGSKTYLPEVRGAVDALIHRVRPDVVLITGDMVAGQAAGLAYGDMWRSFHKTVTGPLTAAGIPVAPAPGNHDASGYAVYAGERAEYARQWTSAERVPAVEFVDRSHYPFRYSFQKGGVFFVALDATMPGKLTSDQRAWVDSQLTSSKVKLKIGYGHLPLHPVAHGRLSEVLGDRELEASFASRGLTAYLSGHHHAYYPGAASGFLQVAMPCLGGGPRPLVGAGRTSPKALVVIDVEDGRVTRVDALESPSFSTSIDRTRLPKRIVHGAHRLERDDIAGLAPAASGAIAISRSR
jgi:hypothetical protein